MKTLVIYHAGCNDGFCAAWLARFHLPADTEFIPANYGELPPDVTGREVYILDFSYKRPIMLDLIDKANKIVCLDHHKTAEEELRFICQGIDIGKCWIVFDMNKSGGRLAWEYFNPYSPAPWIVQYTEDRDLWRWKLAASREVNAALASYPRTFEQWDAFGKMEAPIDTLFYEGSAILRYQQQVVDTHVGFAAETELDGHKILAVNATTMTSEIAGKLAENRPFGVVWFVAKDGKKVWSLRSAPDGLDVSEIARRHGGGGHKNAAGFTETL